MRTHHCIEDLVALARRRQLSPEGLRTLEVLAESSFEVRTLLRAGREFDAARSAIPGDELRVERLARLAASTQETRMRSTRAPRTVALCIGGVFLIGAAAAAGAWSNLGFVKRADAPIAARASVGESRGNARATAKLAALEVSPEVRSLPLPPATVDSTKKPAQLAPRANLAAATVQAPQGASAPQPVETETAALRPGEPARTRVPTDDTPGQLFAAANLARRERRTGDAISLYELLLARFPESPEASDSQLILGKLELDSSPTAALQTFRNYSQGQALELTPEALWGQSQALHSLGRTNEERSTLEQLLNAFPDSPYAEAAKRRLGER